jgi:release factor glutamine methyltransferase
MTEPDLVSVAYAKGAHTFMGLDLIVGEGALVPRPETELLARSALRVLDGRRREGANRLRVIDMCCGAGNLACAVAVHAEGTEVWAADLSPDCVALTRRNVEKHGLTERVRVLEGDLFTPLPREELEGTVDLVVCNPPYISSGRLAEREDLTREPRLAFDGGPYGLSVHQRVSRDALPFLGTGGFLAFEFGLGQERQLRSVVERARGYEGVELVNDDAGNPRVLVAKRRIQ